MHTTSRMLTKDFGQPYFPEKCVVIRIQLTRKNTEVEHTVHFRVKNLTTSPDCKFSVTGRNYLVLSQNVQKLYMKCALSQNAQKLCYEMRALLHNA